MNRFRFTQNEFDRRSNYWGSSGRNPDRTDLYNGKSLKKCTTKRKASCNTKSSKDDSNSEAWQGGDVSQFSRWDGENKKSERNTSSNRRPRETEPTVSPSKNRRSKSRTRQNPKGKDNKTPCPDPSSFNNNRKCARRQSIMYNSCSRMNQSCCPITTNKSTGCNNQGCGSPGCYYCCCTKAKNNGGRRTRSLTPGNKRQRDPRCTCCTSSSCCRARQQQCNQYQYQQQPHVPQYTQEQRQCCPVTPKRMPMKCPPPVQTNKRSHKHNLDCKNECVCFNQKSWTCSQIAIMKTFLSTSSCIEASQVMGVVRCLIRERYTTTNNSNAVKTPRNNSECYEGCDREIEAIRSSLPPDWRPPKSVNGYHVLQSKQARKFTQLGMRRKPKFRSQVEEDEQIDGYSSSGEQDSKTHTPRVNFNTHKEYHHYDQGRFLSSGNDSDGKRNFNTSGDRKPRAQRSWTGVISDCRDFLKCTTEKRHKDKCEFERKMNDAWKHNKRDTQNNQCSDETVSEDDNFDDNDDDYDNGECDTSDTRNNSNSDSANTSRSSYKKAITISDDMGNKISLSRKSFERLCMYIDPTDINKNKTKHKHHSKEYDLDDTASGSSIEKDQIIDNCPPKNKHSTKKNKVSKEHVSQTFQSHPGDAERTMSKSDGVAMNKTKDVEPKGHGVPQEMLHHINTSTQQLLDKASERIKEVGSFLSVSKKDDNCKSQIIESNDRGRNRVRKSLSKSLSGDRLPLDLTTKTFKNTNRNHKSSCVKRDELLAKDEECVLDLDDIRKFKEEVKNISKQIENEKATTKSTSCERPRPLIRENTWIKEKDQSIASSVTAKESSSTVDVDSVIKRLNMNYKGKHSYLDLSKQTSMTSLDTNSTKSDADESIICLNDDEAIRKKGNQMESSIISLDRLERLQIPNDLKSQDTDDEDDDNQQIQNQQNTSIKALTGMSYENFKKQLKGIQETPLIVKCYDSSSPLPEQMRFHLNQ